MGFQASKRLVSVGKEHYSMTQIHREFHGLHGGKELCWGFHLGVCLGDKKPFLTVDKTAAVFYSPGDLMDIVLDVLHLRDPSCIGIVCGQETRDLAKRLKNLKVTSAYATNHLRTVCGVCAQPAYQTMVTYLGNEMSVVAYFRTSRGISLQWPNLPLVNVGTSSNAIWLPIELCRVAPAQYFSSSDAYSSAEMDQYAPCARVIDEDISRHASDTRLACGREFGAFGIRVAAQPDKVLARVLSAPYVQYKNVSVRPKDGRWTLKDKVFVHGVDVWNWGVVSLAYTKASEIRPCVERLCAVGSKCGLNFDNLSPLIVTKDQNPGMTTDQLMRKCYRNLEQRHGSRPQLLVVISAEMCGPSYDLALRTADTDLGVASHCIDFIAVFMGSSDPRFTQMCQQINMKLGGKCSILRVELPLLRTSPTIIIGATVQPPPLDKDDVEPWMAAVVASMDAYSEQYAARVEPQQSSGLIENLLHMLRELFIVYNQRTERKPERVICYVDGGSEDAYTDALQAQIIAFRKVFKLLSRDYKPLVTVIALNQRHHTRTFTVTPRTGHAEAGTVIDSGIVDPHRFDFLLHGSSDPQGFDKTNHYTVLSDENKLTAEDVQSLTYHLGYACSSTCSTSVPAPVHYAKEAAAHACHHLKKSWTAGICRFSLPKVRPNVMDRMYYI